MEATPGTMASVARVKMSWDNDKSSYDSFFKGNPALDEVIRRVVAKFIPTRSYLDAISDLNTAAMGPDETWLEYVGRLRQLIIDSKVSDLTLVLPTLERTRPHLSSKYK